MGLHPCGVFAKIFLVVINVIYVLVGFLLAGVGVVFLVEDDEFQVLTGDNNLVIGIGFMAAGAFMVLIAFLGILSSIGEMTPLLVVYAFLSVAMVGLEVASVAICYVERANITTNADAKFKEYVKKYRDASSDDYDSSVNEVIDIAQSKLHCCGLAGYKDWITFNIDYVVKYGFPSSCDCTDGDDDDDSNCINMNLKNTNNVKGVWRKGCNETFYGLVGSNFTAIGGSGIGIALVQILTVIFAISLCFCIMSAKSTERRIARIQAAAYTQLEEYPTDQDDDGEDDDGHQQSYPRHGEAAGSPNTAIPLDHDGECSPSTTNPPDHDGEDSPNTAIPPGNYHDETDCYVISQEDNNRKDSPDALEDHHDGTDSPNAATTATTTTTTITTTSNAPAEEDIQ